tara:strand:- start:287 stop:499 length:213 start_codon:yes stop_codon:yes gene_type:complete
MCAQYWPSQKETWRKVMAYGLSDWFKIKFLGYEAKKVRARNEDGTYVGDDKSTDDVNEAYKTVAVKKKKK